MSPPVRELGLELRPRLLEDERVFAQRRCPARDPLELLLQVLAHELRVDEPRVLDVEVLDGEVALVVVVRDAPAQLERPFLDERVQPRRLGERRVEEGEDAVEEPQVHQEKVLLVAVVFDVGRLEHLRQEALHVRPEKVLQVPLQRAALPQLQCAREPHRQPPALQLGQPPARGARLHRVRLEQQKEVLEAGAQHLRVVGRVRVAHAQPPHVEAEGLRVDQSEERRRAVRAQKEVCDAREELQFVRVHFARGLREQPRLHALPQPRQAARVVSLLQPQHRGDALEAQAQLEAVLERQLAHLQVARADFGEQPLRLLLREHRGARVQYLGHFPLHCADVATVFAHSGLFGREGALNLLEARNEALVRAPSGCCR